MRRNLIILLTLYTALIAFGQSYVVHREREVDVEKQSVALKERCMNEWVDISDITPSFLSCKIRIIDKTMAFNVETEKYVYSFVEDDWSKVMEILNYVSWKLSRGDEYIINEWLEKLIPQLGMDYVIQIKSTQERNEPVEMQNTEGLNDVLDNMKINVMETEDFSKENKELNNAYTPKQANVKESQKANEKDNDRTGLLGGLLGVIIIYMVFKGLFKIFGSSKKSKKNDSWLDAAWFHDHQQSI